MGGRNQVASRALCAYLVEIKECDGVTSAPEDASFLVKKCILDKIFSVNPDLIAICRSDTTSRINFIPANWEGLKKGVDILGENRSCEGGGGIENPISSLDDVVNAVVTMAEEDEFDEKKIIYFSNLSSYVLNEKEVRKLAAKLCENNVFLNIILPNKADMTEFQMQNSKLIKRVFNQDEYENVSMVTSMDKARRQILNTQTKKAVKPTPWIVQLEISPEIVINVGGYSCTRKNNMSNMGMSRVLVKEAETADSTVGSDDLSSNNPLPSGSNSSVDKSLVPVGKKTVVVEPVKDVVEKERVWAENDGTQVSEDDIGKAYYFGDKLVPYNELEKEDSYHSGGKCLKLLAFCPKEKIQPPFLLGDGTTLFYPKKDDVESEVKFKALITAMINTDRIAIVRRVYRKDSRPMVGTLVPDKERPCLIFTEISFADDISVPQFPYLIKSEEIGDEENNVEVSEKEALIDELISMKSIEYFHPSDGPCDPAIRVMRELVAQKSLEDNSFDSECKKADNIEIFFKGLFVGDEMALSEKIRNSFHLKENKVENERMAGKTIFRKRLGDEMIQSDNEKKPKIEENDTTAEDEVKLEDDEDNLDNLLEGL